MNIQSRSQVEWMGSLIAFLTSAFAWQDLRKKRASFPFFLASITIGNGSIFVYLITNGQLCWKFGFWSSNFFNDIKVPMYSRIKFPEAMAEDAITPCLFSAKWWHLTMFFKSMCGTTWTMWIKIDYHIHYSYSKVAGKKPPPWE